MVDNLPGRRNRSHRNDPSARAPSQGREPVGAAMGPSPRPRAGKAGTGKRKAAGAGRIPTAAQLAWLGRGLSQAGGKLPLFDEAGQRVSAAVIRSCRTAGWVEPWFHNPIKPDWDVCRLTEAGRAMLARLSAAS